MDQSEVARMWEEFCAMSFPPGPYEVGDVELDEVDTFASGCISTFVGTGGLDQFRIEVLRSCLLDLERSVPSLTGESHAYFATLRRLSDAVLKLTTR